MSSCVFCGFTGTLTGEHVFGDWLGRIGLDREPVPHGAGRLNRIGRPLGVRRPFQQTVRDVCGDCNHGWMSRLEVVAQRVLTPLILGKSGALAATDLGAVAAWAQKTALTAMLVSSASDRADGYGLPSGEYQDLYARSDERRPLPASQFWIGRYEGVRQWSARVTPIVVAVDGLPEPDSPHGYVLTIVLGQLTLHGVRFTTPSLELPLVSTHRLARLWPADDPIEWPLGDVVNDEAFLNFAAGKSLETQEQRITVRPWKPATDLSASSAVNGMVRLPTACGRHTVHYPLALVEEARRGRYYTFATSCECPHAYLIETEADGAHCKAVGTEDDISEWYESLPGDEYVIEDQYGEFWCKRLPHQAPEAAPSDDGRSASDERP